MVYLRATPTIVIEPSVQIWSGAQCQFTKSVTLESGTNDQLFYFIQMTSHFKQEFENWDQGFIKKTCTQICPFGRLKNTQNQFTLQT